VNSRTDKLVLFTIQADVTAEFWKTVLLKAAVTSSDVLLQSLMSVCHSWRTIVNSINRKEKYCLLHHIKKTHYVEVKGKCMH